MKRILVSIAVLSFVLTACGGGGDSGGDPTASAWVLESGTVDGADIGLLETNPITLTFDTDLEQAGGVSACNNYFGSYTISGSELSFGEMGQTMMACSPEEVMDAETKYLQALAAVETFSMSGDQLTLTGEGAELVFTVDEEA